MGRNVFRLYSMRLKASITVFKKDRKKMNLIQMQLCIFLTAILCFWIAINSAASEALTLDDLFPTDRVLDVQITVAEKDWDTIRHQQRDFRATLHERRKEAPIDAPYTYVHASVTIDGVDFPDVGLRKKGFLGSLNTHRPSLKIRLNHFDKSGGIEGLTNLTLNNNQQDVSLVSQFMGYALFNAAGSPAPRCAYASVKVNGVNLGIYSHVETVRRSLLERAFGNSDGTLYEGPYVDFYEGWDGSFEHKTGAEAPGREKIVKLIKVLQSDNEDIEQAIGELVHLDSFYTFWSLEGLLGFWDGYSGNSNNFFIYLNPETDKFHFIPWGADSLFVKHSKLRYDRRAPISVKTQGLMAHRLYQLESGRERYAETLTEIMDKHWNEAELSAEVDRIEAMVTPHLVESQRYFYDEEKRKGKEYTFAQALDETREFIRQRRGEIREETADGMPEWRSKPNELFVVKEEDMFKPKPDSIWSAAHTGNTAAIEQYLVAGTDLNRVDAKFGVTPLSWATLGRQIDAAALLIQHGADVNVGNKDGNTPLHTAAFLGEYKIAELLVNSGADVNIANNDGDTPMNSLGADWENTEAIAGWLQIEVEREKVERGRTQVSALLRQNDAQVASPDREDICYAAKNGNIDALRKHLESAADINLRDRRFGITPLAWAALGGHAEIAELLLRSGADVNAKNRDAGTALHGAAFFGRVEVVELLLKNGANTNAKHESGDSPLDSAKVDWETTEFIAGLLDIEIGRSEVARGRADVEALLRANSAKSGHGEPLNSQLCIAAKTGNADAVEKYITAGADINSKDREYGVTPLCWAAFGGNVEIMELLIQQGADVNARNRDAGTALHGAAFFGHAEVVELLIQNGADTHAKHESGDTPYDSAHADWESTQFIAGLLQIEIDREKVNSGRIELAGILRNHNAKADIKR